MPPVEGLKEEVRFGGSVRRGFGGWVLVCIYIWTCLFECYGDELPD